MTALRIAAALGWVVIVVGLAMVVWLTYVDWRSRR